MRCCPSPRIAICHGNFVGFSPSPDWRLTSSTTCFGDFNLLVEAVRPGPRPPMWMSSLAARGPLAPPELCNGLVVPLVVFDQIYSFDIDSLIATIPRPEKSRKEERFEAAAEEVFWRIMQMTDNAGATDEHRALNYLVVRYPGYSSPRRRRNSAGIFR